MKKIVLILAVCALVFAIPLSATAGNAPYNKVTGDIWFGGDRYFAFAGHDVGAPALDKGFAYYTDGTGGYWYGKATSVSVTNDDYADMTVVVTESTYTGISVGTSFTYTFYDLGEPGVGLDYFTFFSAGHYTAEMGNIQVHYYG